MLSGGRELMKVQGTVFRTNMSHCLYLSAKYLVFNQYQKSLHRDHAHKLQDCSHIHQQHSTASTAQPARISSELSARRR